MEPAHLRTYIEGNTPHNSTKGPFQRAARMGPYPYFGRLYRMRPIARGGRTARHSGSETARMTVASIFVGDVAIVPVRSLVPFRLLPFRQCDLFLGDRFPRHGVEQVGNAVQSSPLFVIGLDHIPGRLRGIRSCKHCVSSARIVVPAPM